MAGRGIIAEAPPVATLGGRIKVLRMGKWQNIYRPVNPDRGFSGVCLAESFAKSYAEAHPDCDVGLIPAADGGTSIDQWAEGGLLFDHAVMQARLAMRSSHLCGILWHQGEADCGEEKHPLYLEKIKALMAALRREIGACDIPLIVGGLGDFLKDRAESPNLKNYPFINDALREFARSTPMTAFASAEGLGSNPDNLHFSASSLLELGLRYYAAFETVENKSRRFDDIGDEGTDRTAMELL